MGDRKSFVQLKQLSKSYKNEMAVKPLTYDIKEGACIALLGPNGAGKTTTLQMLAGIMEPTAGEVHFQTTVKDNRELIGYLPQQPQLYGWMNAYEFLQLCGQLHSIPKLDLQKQITEVLQFVGLADIGKKRLAGFSGGMKQRIGLAQAILHKPKLLILDEPVSALDPTGRKEVLALIQEMKKEMTIIFSTHILHDAEQVCDEIMIMQKGELKWNGSLSSLREPFKTRKVGIKSVQSLRGVFDERDEVLKVNYINENELELVVNKDIKVDIFWELLYERGKVVRYFNADELTLEDAYLEVLSL